MDKLLDRLDSESPAHRATAQAIREAMWRHFMLNGSCFIGPGLTILFGEEWKA